MPSALGMILGLAILIGLAVVVWKTLQATYRSANETPISGPAALGKGLGIAAVGGPLIEMSLSIVGSAISEQYQSSILFSGATLIVVVGSAYVSGYVAAHTYENTRLMNGKLNAVLGGLARAPALFLLAATRPEHLSWLAFCLFFPCALVGAIHRDRTSSSCRLATAGCKPA